MYKSSTNKSKYRGARGKSNNKWHKSSNTTSKGGYSRWGKKNRKRTTEKIDYSLYISNPKAEAQNKFVPTHSFLDFGFHRTLEENIKKQNYLKPTKIQDEAIPFILKGRDIIGLANTGSGKTGAFLIPMIDKALKNPSTKVLIITPTRELASQINNEFRKFAQNTNLRIVLVIGGANMRSQSILLSKKPQFVVATPGRLADQYRNKKIDLSIFNNVILDEVDQMLEIGFLEEVKDLISKLSSQKQSLFFSATMNQKAELVAQELLKNPIKVESHRQVSLNNIEQDIVKVKTRHEKIEKLHDILINSHYNKVLVFSKTRAGSDEVAEELRKRGFKADSIHGDKSQSKRFKVLRNFREDKIDILVATDVAARGIDVPDISHVINYDEPASYHDYIHRIGRTGRIGKKGIALTFVVDRFSN